MRKLLAWLLLAVSLAGLGLAVDLVGLHYDLRFDPEKAADSPCEVGETLSCGEVNSSRWSEIPLGEGRAALPTAVPAIGFFAAAALLALIAVLGSDERRRKASALLHAMGTAGVAVGLYLVWVQAFALHAWCLFCLAVDLCSLLLAVGAVFSHGGGPRGVLFDLRKPDPGLAALSAVVFLVIGGGAYGSYNGRVAAAGGLTPRTLAGRAGDRAASSDDDRAEVPDGHDAVGEGDDDSEHVKTFAEMSPEERAAAIEESRQSILELYGAHAVQPVHELSVEPFDLVKGNPKAAVVLVEFADFECPFCRQVAFFLQDISQRYYDLALFVFKHWPLGSGCNDTMSRDMHPTACETAVGVQCARRKGQGWQFHDHAFDNQGSLGTRTLLRISGELGIERDWFKTCLASDDVWNEVRGQVHQGQQLGIRGTPTVFVAGRELVSMHPLAIEAILRLELKKAGVPEQDLPPDPEGFFP